ncbi:hypothetical protein M405DRAFT_828247 [Rhizopogon salebrosus TDB-379]|nr:hypothetical protein M405DRAFT_828247 [Rhizopogon salebrosus TDB-379]
MTDAGRDNSSDCQALPIESTEDKIQRLAQFLPLVNQLLMARSKGIMKPTRSDIAVALRQHDKDVFKRAGVDRFGEYAWKAEKASIVELGGKESQGEPAWISLHPSWFKINSSTLLNVQSNGPPPPQTNTKVSTSSAAQTPPPSTMPQPTTQKPKTPTPPPSALLQPTTPKPKTPIPTPPPSTLPQPTTPNPKIPIPPSTLPQSTTPKPKTPNPIPPPSTLPQRTKRKPKALKPTPPPSTLPQPTTPKPNIPIPPPSTLPQPTTTKPKTPVLSAMSDKPIPFCFYPLITCLVNVHKAGMTQPLLSSVGLVLGPVAYARAGASSLHEYLALAMDAEIVECGGAGSSAWVRLYPDVLSGQRCF